MKKIIILYFICISFYANAQELTPSVLATGGGISKNAAISLEWTLGELSIESITTGTNLYTQGFHQPVIIAKQVFTKYIPAVSGYTVSIAPNPVNAILTAKIVSPNDKKNVLTLIDFSGKRFYLKTVTGKFSTSHINLSGFQAGIYLLEVRNEAGNLINTFKIIKSQ